MYHRVGQATAGEPAITRALTVATAVFDAQMEWLKRAGFHAITLQQLYDALEHGGPLPPHPIAITFDDGYRDVLWNAAPLLHRLRMRATEFVISGRVDDGDPSFLSWPELRRLERMGFAIGSHTVHHLDLTVLPRAQVQYELDASRAALMSHLHRPISWFAYPAGREDALVRALVRRAGYLAAVTTQPGAEQDGRQPFLLHRDAVYSWTDLRVLQEMLG
jgi:peptidoglycan/xylan/chitin deacetylase (PgdA/CDA1 family)